MEKLLKILNEMLESMDRDVLTELTPEMSLRDDFGFDSFDLAELTVRIDDVYDIDIFESGVVDTISEVLEKLEEGK